MSVPLSPETQHDTQESPDFELPAPGAIERVLNNLLPPDTARMFAELHAAVLSIRDALCIERLPNIEYPFAVGGTSAVFIVHTAGRRYNMIWIPTASLALTVSMAGGDQQVTFANVGWNVVNFAEGTRLSSSAGTVSYLLWRVTDDPQGGLF